MPVDRYPIIKYRLENLWPDQINPMEWSILCSEQYGNVVGYNTEGIKLYMW